MGWYGKYGEKIIYSPNYCMAFKVPFTTKLTINSINSVDIRIEFYLNKQTKHVKISFTPGRYASHITAFHETHNCWTTSGRDLLHQISAKLVTKCGNYGVETRFRRSVKRDCHWVDFHETQGLQAFDNSLLKKKKSYTYSKIHDISQKRFSCRQRATNGRMCSPLFRKEGLIRQTIFEQYIHTVNTTRLPLPNICLQSNPTQSIFIGDANDR